MDGLWIGDESGWTSFFWMIVWRVVFLSFLFFCFGFDFFLLDRIGLGGEWSSGVVWFLCFALLSVCLFWFFWFLFSFVVFVSFSPPIRIDLNHSCIFLVDLLMDSFLFFSFLFFFSWIFHFSHLILQGMKSEETEEKRFWPIYWLIVHSLSSTGSKKIMEKEKNKTKKKEKEFPLLIFFILTFLLFIHSLVVRVNNNINDIDTQAKELCRRNEEWRSSQVRTLFLFLVVSVSFVWFLSFSFFFLFCSFLFDWFLLFWWSFFFLVFFFVFVEESVEMVEYLEGKNEI